jgi:hypothetical protein
VRCIVTGRTTDIIRSYEDWLRYMVAQRHALLLASTPEAESAFGVRPGRTRPVAVPGRALLVHRAGTTALQVATVG